MTFLKMEPLYEVRIVPNSIFKFLQISAK